MLKSRPKMIHMLASDGGYDVYVLVISPGSSVYDGEESHHAQVLVFIRSAKGALKVVGVSKREFMVRGGIEVLKHARFTRARDEYDLEISHSGKADDLWMFLGSWSATELGLD